MAGIVLEPWLEEEPLDEEEPSSESVSVAAAATGAGADASVASAVLRATDGGGDTLVGRVRPRPADSARVSAGELLLLDAVRRMPGGCGSDLFEADSGFCSSTNVTAVCASSVAVAELSSSSCSSFLAVPRAR